MATPLLEVRKLRVEFPTPPSYVRSLRRSSYVLPAEVNSCRVQIVRPASQTQICGRRLAALCMRNDVIEL